MHKSINTLPELHSFSVIFFFQGLGPQLRAELVEEQQRQAIEKAMREQVDENTTEEKVWTYVA